VIGRILATLALALVAVTPAASAQTFNAQEQAEIRAIVRDYLVRNPDVLREALDSLETRVSSERWREITTDPRDFAIGPADAQVVIVEFFDYRCPYCHAALEWVSDVTRTRRDVRVIFKELPILSDQSMEAARAAIAAIPQGRYWQFHQALMAHRGELDSSAIDAIARRAGVDVARMRRDMSDPEITALLEENRAQAMNYNISGTPGFVINGELVPGFDRERLDARLRQAAREARERSSAAR
jgi:protein-disulfide isomerase